MKRFSFLFKGFSTGDGAAVGTRFPAAVEDYWGLLCEVGRCHGLWASVHMSVLAKIELSGRGVAWRQRRKS